MGPRPRPRPLPRPRPPSLLGGGEGSSGQSKRWWSVEPQVQQTAGLVQLVVSWSAGRLHVEQLPSLLTHKTCWAGFGGRSGYRRPPGFFHGLDFWSLLAATAMLEAGVAAAV